MSWKYVKTVDESFESHDPRRVRQYMVNDQGIEIARTGLEFNGGNIHFEYCDSGADLKSRFFCWGSGIPKDYQKCGMKIFALGPVCSVTAFSNQISRPITIEEGENAAAMVREFLLQFQNFPDSFSPYPQRVLFNKIAAKTLRISEPIQ